MKTAEYLKRVEKELISFLVDNRSYEEEDFATGRGSYDIKLELDNEGNVQDGYLELKLKTPNPWTEK